MRGLANIAQLLMNAAMLIERENHIGAGPYQRGVERNGHANGFKPRTFQTAIFNAVSRPNAEECLRVFLETWREKQPKLVA